MHLLINALSMKYTVRTFDLPELQGLSKKQIDIHLALYAGYVTHTNLILETIEKLRESDATGNSYLIRELRRRLSFEFNGMRMHEYYFEQVEHHTVPAEVDGSFVKLVSERYGSWQKFIDHLHEVAGTRGVGWVVVYLDTAVNTVVAAWVNDHEVGQLGGLPILLAIDLWEHAYMVDYTPADKKDYVSAYLNNLNWNIVEHRYLSRLS